MLVTLKEILCLAEARNIAVGSFNTPNLESIMAVIDAAEELDVPVIIMHAEVHESIMPISIIGPIMIERARAAKVPVCVHLDHGENLEYVNKALSLGFTSVMYDGSALEYSINVANTKIVVGMAKRVGASVEAEIGTLGKRELGYKTESNEPEPEQVYTNPDDAKRFVESTGIDALACSFGTAHGLYLKKPKLDFTVLDKVRENVKLPIVMHGGSGVSDEDYRTVISKGVRKINYYTYMAKAGGEKIKEKFDLKMFPLAYQGTNYHCYYSVVAEEKDAPVYYHDIVEWGYQAMKNNVRKALTVFANK
jgi:fructose-bisphosphate aldolase class II